MSGHLLDWAVVDDQAVASLAHELRTPVHAIRASAELILGGDAGPVDDRALALIGDIADAARRLDRLVGLLVSGTTSTAGPAESVELLAVLRAERVRLDAALVPAPLGIDSKLLSAIVSALCGAMLGDEPDAGIEGRAMPEGPNRGGIVLERVPPGGRLAELRSVCQWAERCLMGTGLQILCSAEGAVGISWPHR